MDSQEWRGLRDLVVGQRAQKGWCQKVFDVSMEQRFLSPEDGESMDIELQVDRHPSGNLTLKQRVADEAMWVDILEPSGVWAKGPLPDTKSS